MVQIPFSLKFKSRFKSFISFKCLEQTEQKRVRPNPIKLSNAGQNETGPTKNAVSYSYLPPVFFKGHIRLGRNLGYTIISIHNSVIFKKYQMARVMQTWEGVWQDWRVYLAGTARPILKSPLDWFSTNPEPNDSKAIWTLVEYFVAIPFFFGPYEN